MAARPFSSPIGAMPDHPSADTQRDKGGQQHRNHIAGRERQQISQASMSGRASTVRTGKRTSSTASCNDCATRRVTHRAPLTRYRTSQRRQALERVLRHLKTSAAMWHLPTASVNAEFLHTASDFIGLCHGGRARVTAWPTSFDDQAQSSAIFGPGSRRSAGARAACPASARLRCFGRGQFTRRRAAAFVPSPPIIAVDHRDCRKRERQGQGRRVCRELREREPDERMLSATVSCHAPSWRAGRALTPATTRTFRDRMPGNVCTRPRAKFAGRRGRARGLSPCGQARRIEHRGLSTLRSGKALAH